ncbi:MAG: hypothetical protein ABSD81_00340 [Methanomicrobiales archaeon]
MENTVHLSDFLKKINYNWDNCELEPDSGDSVLDLNPSIFEITPQDFLEFAEKDLEKQDLQAMVNALSNIKRSIECQIDVALYSFKIPYERMSFPDKVEVLRRMGLSSPDILKKINRIRVELEHFYKRPKVEQVNDAVDVAHLTLDAISYPLHSFWSNFYIAQQDEDNVLLEYRYWNVILFRFKQEKGEFVIKHLENGNESNSISIFSSNLDDYLNLINFTINLGKILYRPHEESELKRTFKHFRNLFKF